MPAGALSQLLTVRRALCMCLIAVCGCGCLVAGETLGMCDPALAGKHGVALSLDAKLVPLYRKMCDYADTKIAAGGGGSYSAAGAQEVVATPGDIARAEAILSRHFGTDSGAGGGGTAPPLPPAPRWQQEAPQQQARSDNPWRR